MFVMGLLVGFLLNNLFVVTYMALAVKEDRIARRYRRTPENVDDPMCPTCGGDGNARPFLGKHTPDDPCPTCNGTGSNPENVDSP